MIEDYEGNEIACLLPLQITLLPTILSVSGHVLFGRHVECSEYDIYILNVPFLCNLISSNGHGVFCQRKSISLFFLSKREEKYEGMLENPCVQDEISCQRSAMSGHVMRSQCFVFCSVRLAPFSSRPCHFSLWRLE